MTSILNHQLDVPFNSALAVPFTAERQRLLVTRWGTWLAQQEAQMQISRGTVRLYLHACRAWIRFLEELAKTDAPTPLTVGAFLAAALPGRHPASANTLLAGVRSLYRWTASIDAWPEIGRSIKPVKVSRDGPMEALSHEQVARLLPLIEGNGPQQCRDRAIVAILYTTAIRTVSLHRASIRDFDASAHTLLHQAKGHRLADTTAFLSGHASRLLSDYLVERGHQEPLEPASPLIATCDPNTWGRRMTARSISAVISKLLERAGYRRRNEEGHLLQRNTWGAHCLRRSALTVTADKHGLEAARALAGHSSVETTRRSYVRVKLHQQLKSVANTLDLNYSAT